MFFFNDVQVKTFYVKIQKKILVSNNEKTLYLRKKHYHISGSRRVVWSLVSFTSFASLTRSRYYNLCSPVFASVTHVHP